MPTGLQPLSLVPTPAVPAVPTPPMAAVPPAPPGAPPVLDDLALQPLEATTGDLGTTLGTWGSKTK